MDEAVEYKVQGIGIYHSKQVHPYDAGRQPDAHHQSGMIELNAGQNFEQALIGLKPQQMIWILFVFHHNSSWKPMVLPPRGGNQKIGVFATRSPYRPNQIGISAVRIIDIKGLKIFIEGADLLDQTPIVDIKPYLSYADSFTDETPEWLRSTPLHSVTWSNEAQKHLDFLKDSVPNLSGFVTHQLEYEPTNSQKKRVKNHDSGFTLAYRTWRVDFVVTDLHIMVLKIYSGYSQEDLTNSEDPYKDKEIHRKFTSHFGKN